MSFWASIKPKEEKKQGPYIAPTLPTTDNSTVAFRDATAKSDIVGTAKTTGTIAKVLGQSIMREGAALSSFAFPNVGPLTPTGPVQEAIYGTDKPITLTSFGREVRMADPEGESKGFWKTFDPALGLLVGALDVMPGGKPTKSLITGFAKETSQAKIADDLVKIAPKLAPDTVWGLAGKLAAETSEDEVRMLLQNADIIPKASNANRGVTGTAKLENIADDDLGEIIDFVDSVRLGEEPTANNSIAARRLAERYGINPEQSDARLANALQNKIEATPTVREKVVNRSPEMDGGATQRQNLTNKDEFAKEQYETTYRGASKAEWENIQKTGKVQEKAGTRMIDKKTGKEISYGAEEGVNTTPEKKLADLYGTGVGQDGVVIEFKPEAKAKMRFSAKFDSTDLKADEYLGRELTLDDIAKVTDKNGNVIYDAAAQKGNEAPPILRAGQPPVGVDAADPRNYKSAEEFVDAQQQVPFSQSFSMTNKLTAGDESLFRPSKTSVYHGTDALNIEKIISSGELSPRVSKFDDARERVVSLSKNRNIAETQGGSVVFEFKNNKVKTRPAPGGVIKGDGLIDGFEVRSDTPLKLSDVETAYIHIKKGEDLNSPIKDVRRIDRFGNTEIYDKDTYAGVKDKLEKAGIKVTILDENLTKSQLTDMWNKANETMEGLLKHPESFGVAAGAQDTDGDGKPDDINPLMAALGVAGMGALRKTTATPNQMSQAGRLVDDLVPPGGVDIPPTTAAQAEKISDTLSSSKTVAQKFKTVFTNIVEHVQNSEERVRQLTTQKNLNTATDPYEIMTLYHGRVGKKIEEGYQRAEEIADDIISFSGRNKTDVLDGRQEVNDYLQALHAGERNAAHGEGAAGMTTEDAAEILKKASPEVKAVAKKAQDLNNKTLDLLKDSGVITPELYTTLRTKYKNHVPLQRVMDEQDDIGAVLSGRGFDVRSTGVKAAKGSNRQVADILTNIVNNYEQAVLRSEKNIVDQATLKFVRNNADDLKNIAGVRKPRAVGTRFDTPRKVEELQGMEWETPFTPKEINEALGQAEMEVLTQMELSTAGKRIFLDHDATRAEGNVMGMKSTFPDWVPEHLREKDLFDKVISQYNKGIAQRGNATKQKELYDVMQNEIASRVPMDVRDEMALTEISKGSEVRASLVEKVKAKKGATIFESTNDPKILQLFEEGRPVWIEFKDEKLAIAFRGVGREKLGVLLNSVGAFTRFYSGLATRFNPEFALPNKIRDLQETMTFLASQGDVGFKGAAKTAVVDPASMKAVLDGVRGADTPGAKLYNEMRSLGGTTGGMGLSTRKQTQLNIDKIFNIASSRPRQAAQKLVEYVDNWNTIFEDSTRLSVYKIALEKGATKERAAFLAKEASINFNRSGRGGPVLNALWMFSNASIQGSTKMIRAMKNPKVAAAVGATIMGSVAAVSEWNDRVDPDWRDKVTKWDRINGLPIVLPTEDGSTRYMVIPISWGLKPILVMSNAGYDSVSGVDVDPLDATQRILSSFVDAYNPVGGTDFTSAVTPTILDAPVEVARNQSWSGSLIRPIPYNNEPKDIQYFQSLADTKQGRIAIETTKKLQENYGILMSPADVDYVITQYIGGAGRSIKKTNEVLYGLSSDDPMPPADEWPFVSRFLRMRTSEETGQGAGGEIEKLKNSLSDQARERFQTNEEAEATYKTMKELPQEVAAERFEVLKETNPILADKIVEIAKDEKKGLTYEDKLVKALGVENGERARYLLEQFNKEKSDEGKAALWEEYQTKGLITKQVSEQLRYLLNQ